MSEGSAQAFVPLETLVAMTVAASDRDRDPAVAASPSAVTPCPWCGHPTEDIAGTGVSWTSCPACGCECPKGHDWAEITDCLPGCPPLRERPAPAVAQRGVSRELDRLRETMSAVAAATGTSGAESIDDARRRNFEEACAAAKARDRRRELRRAAERAADLLWERGIRAYAVDDGWLVIDDGDAPVLDDATLIAFASSSAGGSAIAGQCSRERTP